MYLYKQSMQMLNWPTLRCSNCNTSQDMDKAVALDQHTCLLKIALALSQLLKILGSSITEQPVTADAVVFATTGYLYKQTM